jgi:hypothetical protein
MTQSDLEDKYQHPYETWQDLDTAVRANSGVLHVGMWQLRHISGYQRLKVNVVKYISDELADNGLSHLPAELPRDQDEYVMLYKVRSEAGAVINAVLLNGSNREEAVRALRKLNTSEAVQAGRQNEAKLAELAAKVDELENLLKGFREVLDA